jgi:hypothetical protein
VSAAAEDCLPEPPFTGTWEWLDSSGGFAGHTIGPADVGYTIQLEIRADGLVRSYVDEIFQAESRLYPDCEAGLRLGAQPSVPAVSLISDCAPYLAMVVPGISGPELRLTDIVCFDGYDHRLGARAPVGAESSDWSRIKAVYR